MIYRNFACPGRVASACQLINGHDTIRRPCFVADVGGFYVQRHDNDISYAMHRYRTVAGPVSKTCIARVPGPFPVQEVDSRSSVAFSYTGSSRGAIPLTSCPPAMSALSRESRMSTCPDGVPTPFMVMYCKCCTKHPGLVSGDSYARRSKNHIDSLL